MPLARSQNDDRGWDLEGIGRLKPGMSLELAKEDLTRIHKGLIPGRPVNDITSPRLTPLRGPEARGRFPAPEPSRW